MTTDTDKLVEMARAAGGAKNFICGDVVIAFAPAQLAAIRAAMAQERKA